MARLVRTCIALEGSEKVVFTALPPQEASSQAKVGIPIKKAALIAAVLEDVAMPITAQAGPPFSKEAFVTPTESTKEGQARTIAHVAEVQGVTLTSNLLAARALQAFLITVEVSTSARSCTSAAPPRPALGQEVEDNGAAAVPH